MPFLLALLPVWNFAKSLLAKIPAVAWLVIALVAVVWFQHAKLTACQAAIVTKDNALRVAADANQAEQKAIVELQAAVSTLQSQLGQERAAAAAAVDKASQTALALQARLAGAQQTLSDLQKNPSYASLLNIDLDAQYPDLARGLRQLDAAGQN